MRNNKIKLLLLISLLVWASIGMAVITDYTFTSNPGTYTPFTGGTVHGTPANDNEVFTDIPLGFDFTYNSIVYTSISIAANGFIAMGPAVATSNTAISTGTTNNVVVPLNRDIKSRDDGTLSSGVSGTAPNRVYTVQWQNYRRVPTAAANDTLNFQLKLFETTNIITFNYGYFNTPTVSTAATVQVGLRGASNAEYINRTTTTNWAATTSGLANTASCTINATVFPPNGLVFTWTPPQAGTPPNPAQIVSPANTAVNISINATLNWLTGGGSPTGYKIYLGTDNPPTNIVNGTVQTGTTFVPGAAFAYSTTYYWQIIPTNDFGDAVGCPVWSFTTMPDPLVTVFPYMQNWDSITAPAVPPSWTIVNANADNFTWVTVSNGAFSAPNALRCSFNSSSAIPMNDWAISPPLQLMSGTTYRVTFRYRAQNATSPEKMKVMFGTSNTPAGLTNQIFINENITNTAYTLGEAFIVPPTDGIYYVGWHAFSNANSFYLFIDDIAIAEYVVMFNPPQNLTATGGTGVVNLSWQAPQETVPTGYNVYRNDILITPSPLAGLSYADNTVALGTTYTYYVTAVYTNPNGESVPSNAVEAESLNPPTSLVAQVNFTNVTLTWNSPMPAARARDEYMPTRALTGFKIYRDTELLETITNPATLSYMDSNLSNGTYSYQVTATYSTGESVPAGPAQAVISVNFYPPSNLVATAGGTSINLTWNAPVPLLPNLFGYRVYRDGVNLTHTPISALAYQDENVVANVLYNYYIVAVYTNPNGVSEPSNTASATILELLNPVTNLTATVSHDSVSLDWDAPVRNLLGYKVYRDGIPYYNINNPAVTSITDYDLPNGTFTYYVTALYTAGESEPSETVSAVINVSSAQDEPLPVTATFLHNNYPNPFNPRTFISYDLKSDGQVVLEIYNLKGQKIRTLVNGAVKSGRHTVVWKGDDDSGKAVPGGVYLYRLATGSFTSTRKMIMLK